MAPINVSLRTSPVPPTTFEIPVEDFRSQPLPGFERARVGSCFIRVADMPDLDNWLEVNPRVPKRNVKDVLVGEPAKGIIRTLTYAPADMAIKNLGLYLLVESAEHERHPAGKHILRFVLSDTSRHGLANGGHTYAAIRQWMESRSDASSEDAFECSGDAYVRLHVYQGIPVDKVVEMAEGLNRSKQVDDVSLMNLKGLFKSVKDVMEGHPGADQIYYNQGGDYDDVDGSVKVKEYYAPEVLLYLELLNCARFDRTKHPNGLYRYQKRLLEMFREDVGKVPSPMDLLVPRLPEVLVLSDRIRKAVPAAAKSCQFEMGRMKPDSKKKLRAGNDKHKNTPLHFIGETMSYRIPNGWLLPMLAAFRANIRWDLEKSIFQWIAPLDDVLNATIEDLVRVCVVEHRDNGEKPEDVGTKASTYSQCYDKVELYLLRKGK